MFGEYEATLNYQLPQEVLKTVMDEAVDRYLASHQNVFPIDREDCAIELKVQKSCVSRGEIVAIAIQNETIYVVSKYIQESGRSLVAWIKNRYNVLILAAYIKDAIHELSYGVVA